MFQTKNSDKVKGKAAAPNVLVGRVSFGFQFFILFHGNCFKKKRNRDSDDDDADADADGETDHEVEKQLPHVRSGCIIFSLPNILFLRR